MLHASVALHVLVIVYSWGHPPATVASRNVTAGTEQLSVATAIPVDGGKVLAVHSRVKLPGHTIIVGGVESSTVIICTHVDELLHASVALHVLVIMYSWGHPPATVASKNVTTGIEQLSVAVASPVPGGKVFVLHCMVMLAGQDVIVGGVESSTIIVCTQVEELLHASVALQVLIIVYSCGHPPPTVISRNVTVGVEQLSVAVATPVDGGNVLAVHSSVKLAGQKVMVGGVESSTIIVCRHIDELLHASVAPHVLRIIYSCGHPPAMVASR